MITVPITSTITVGESSPLLIIAGPCQLESRDHALSLATAIADIGRKFPIQLVFKASFDKANRTSINTARGVGIEAGLRILEEVRKETELPVITDIHSPEQAVQAAAFVDILQIPAFLCRQTDLIVAAGKTNKPINLKKGQFVSPNDMKFAAEKIASTGNNKILLCERGTSFGYHDLVVDMRSLVIMRNHGYPVIFDATHSVQSPGGEADGTSGGKRQFIRPLVRAAVAVGVDGVFMEVHENPEKSPSDAASILPLKEFEPILREICQLREVSIP